MCHVQQNSVDDSVAKCHGSNPDPTKLMLILAPIYFDYAKSKPENRTTA